MTRSELKAAKQAKFAGLCDFILDWYEVDERLTGSPIDPQAQVPEVVRVLNAKLGMLWQQGDHPIGQDRLGLFNCQGSIINPAAYSEDTAPAYGEGGDLVVCALAENQGVTNYGFALDDPDGAVYVCGDWLGEYRPWRPTDGYIEDAFANWLLINSFVVDGLNYSTNRSLDSLTIELYMSGPGLGSDRYGVWRALTDETRHVIHFDHLGWMSRER